MDVLNIKRRELNNLKKINYGSESDIYKISDHEILKKFRESTSETTIRNKIKKLEILDQIDSKYLVKPLKIVKDKSNIIGYTMEYDREDEAMDTYPLLREDELNVLKKVKFINKKLFSKGVFYGDLSKSNILINRKTGNIKFCDIDNTKIADLPMDLLSVTLAEYMGIIGEIDEKTLSYIHNVLTLKLLYEDTEYFADVVDRVEENIYPQEFTEKAKIITKKVVNLDNKYKDEYIIDYVKMI